MIRFFKKQTYNIQFVCITFFPFQPFVKKAAKQLEYIHTKQTQRVVDSKPGYLLVLSTNHYCSYASDTPRKCRVGSVKHSRFFIGWVSKSGSNRYDLENWNSQIFPFLGQPKSTKKIVGVFFSRIHVRLPLLKTNNTKL